MGKRNIRQHQTAVLEIQAHFFAVSRQPGPPEEERSAGLLG